MFAIKNQSLESNLLEDSSKFSLKGISNDYILLDEKETLDFIKNIGGLKNLINESLEFFKKHFPNGKYYLALEEDYECSALDAIFVYIVNKEGSFEENSKVEDILFNDLLKLKNKYPKAWLKFGFIVEEDDEYYELWRKGIIDNY